MFEFDWKYPYRNFLDRAKRKWDCFIKKRFEEYWYSIFSTRSDLKRHFDELIVINGCSLHPCFLKKIRSLNRNVKAILYLWDNSSFYNYYYYIKEFDKVMTYDINDSKKYGVRLLPFYWENNKNISFFSGPKYKLSMVGSNHSGRLQIARSVSEQLENEGYSYYIKVVDKTQNEDDIIIHDSISPEDVQKIMMDSECVLDTDRASQTGTTPRLIWALALGKKVITTNMNVKQMPLYDPERISFIDRMNPILDEYFLKKKIKQKELSPYLLSLRLDNWIKNFII